MLKCRYLLLSLLLTAPVQADHLPIDIEPGSSVNEIALPLNEKTAAELAQVETGGKVLSVDQEHSNSHVYFRVKVLHQDGMVKIHRIDRDTGHRVR